MVVKRIHLCLFTPFHLYPRPIGIQPGFLISFKSKEISMTVSPTRVFQP